MIGDILVSLSKEMPSAGLKEHVSPEDMENAAKASADWQKLIADWEDMGQESEESVEKAVEKILENVPVEQDVTMDGEKGTLNELVESFVLEDGEKKESTEEVKEWFSKILKESPEEDISLNNEEVSSDHASGGIEAGRTEVESFNNEDMPSDLEELDMPSGMEDINEEGREAQGDDEVEEKKLAEIEMNEKKLDIEMVEAENVSDVSEKPALFEVGNHVKYHVVEIDEQGDVIDYQKIELDQGASEKEWTELVAQMNRGQERMEQSGHLMQSPIAGMSNNTSPTSDTQREVAQMLQGTMMQAGKENASQQVGSRSEGESLLQGVQRSEGAQNQAGVVQLSIPSMQMTTEALQAKLQQVLGQMEQMRMNANQLHVQLTPKDLGTVDVFFRQVGGTTEVFLEVDNRAGQQRIEAIIDELKRMDKSKEWEFYVEMKEGQEEKASEERAEELEENEEEHRKNKGTEKFDAIWKKHFA